MKKLLPLVALAILLVSNSSTAEEQFPEYEFIWEGATIHIPRGAQVSIMSKESESNSTTGEMEFSGNVSVKITINEKSLEFTTEKIVARPKTALKNPIDFHRLLLEQNPHLKPENP